MDADLAQSIPFIYLVSAVLFILGLKRLSMVRTARRGNNMAILAMGIAVVGTVLEVNYSASAQGIPVNYTWILGGMCLGAVVGAVIAIRVAMTAMPEMVALFNGLGGLASVLVALAVVWERLVEPVGLTGTASTNFSGGSADVVTVGLSVLIGSVTLSGSLIAFLKLQGKLKQGAAILVPGRHVINAALLVACVALAVWFGFFAPQAGGQLTAILAFTAVAIVLGVLLVLPIGGADMPVVVSLLNSYSGLAACATGFVIGNQLLIIAGAMVGAAGLILTQIMCVAMNRSLLNVLAGGFGATTSVGNADGADAYGRVTSCGAEEAAMILEDAERVMIVPGYGLAVAQAQHAVRELAEALAKRGTEVRYAIHPVAGRMPGHMNVLLAEADVPYDELLDITEANPRFRSTDVTLVIGANDVVNPAALDDKTSPIYGMPILPVHESRTVIVIKRSLSPGYAGIKNGLFEAANTMMIFGDAKKVVQAMIGELKS